MKSKGEGRKKVVLERGELVALKKGVEALKEIGNDVDEVASNFIKLIEKGYIIRGFPPLKAWGLSRCIQVVERALKDDKLDVVIKGVRQALEITKELNTREMIAPKKIEVNYISDKKEVVDESSKVLDVRMSND